MTEVRKTTRGKGDLDSLQRKLWSAICKASETATKGDMNAMYALSALAGSYMKAFEIAEINARIEALESKLKN